MSVQVDPYQGHHELESSAQLMDSTAAGLVLQDMQAAAGAVHNANGIPESLSVCCNGNYGVYLIERRGVQCMCLPCQAERAPHPRTAWIMSPTEFERHSGMPTAKKWRMSIKVAHVGEPDLPLGRWLELKGIAQTRGMKSGASPDRTQEHRPKQASSAADSRDTTDALRPCANSLARVLLQGLGRDQSGQMQGSSRPGTPQRTSSNSQQQQEESHRLSEEPPHFSNGSNERTGYSIDVAAQLRSCFPTHQTGTAVSAAAKMEAARVAAYTAAAAEAQAAAAQAERQVCGQQQHQHEQGSDEASPVGGRSSSSTQGGQPRPSPPALLQIPYPADAPPGTDELHATAAAMYQGVDPVPLEEAVAAAARGDDSLWLRSPMRRTPCSARQGPGNASRMSNQEAVAAEAFRRLITAHLHPNGANSTGSLPRQGSGGLSSAAAAAAALLAGSLPAGGGSSRPSDGSSCDATAAAAGGSMDSLAAAAAAAAAADAAEAGAAGVHDDEDDDAEGGICVGPQHQADLPSQRPLPAFAAAVALMELRKSGNRGPAPEEVLRLALEEKSRSDLLPRDAVEDVWERTSTGLALERAQRHRKPPGWQAGYVDPLKPLTAQHQHTDSGPYGNLAVHENGHEADSTKHRKRSNFEEALLQSTKKLRCSSAGPSGVLQPPHNALQASRFGPRGPNPRRTSLDGAACCSEPACPTNALHGPPRVPPNGFWAPARQPTFTAPMGPELLSWVLMVPPAAATLSKPAWASASAAPAAAEAAAAQQDAAAAQHQEGVDADKVVDGSSQQQPAAGAAVNEQAAAEQGNSMEVDIPATQEAQQQQAEQQGDVEMASAPQEGLIAANTDAAAAPGVVVASAAAAEALAPAAPTVCAAEIPAASAAAAAAPGHSLEVVPAQGSAVEVRIVLDGCVFVGQLKEVSRLEMARSRVGAAVEPIKQTEVHNVPPPGTTCVLCHAPEAPGSHMDQAKALRSSGLSNRGLGPLMPVCMPPAKPAGSGSNTEPQPGSGVHHHQVDAEGAAPISQQPPAAVAAAEGGAAAAEAGTATPAVSAPAAESEVVWLHRQCALWSPEVYPDKTGMLMHLPGAIRRGKATRCGHCSQKGATLKCVERSCAQHFHLACARVAGCTLIPEPYAVGCPAHESTLPELPPAASLGAFPASKAPQDARQQQQQQQHAVIPEHPQLPVLRCRTTRHRAPGDVGGSGTPVHSSRDRDGSFTPVYPGGGSPMHVDSCGLGGESDFTPRAGSEDRDMDGHTGNGTHVGHKRSRGGQSRLRRQTNTDWADASYEPRPNSPAHMNDGTPGANHPRPSNSRGSKGARANGDRGSFGSQQMHDSKGRFMSHAAAQLLASGFTSTPPGSARQRSLGRDMFDNADSRGGTPAMSDGGYSTPRGVDPDADGNMSDVSSGAPLSEANLGGTTGQPGRAGRCAVCVVQRKGKCGTESAPKKCLRRQLMEQQQAERAKKAAPIHSVAAAANAVAAVAAEAAALAALRGSPALMSTPEPTSATAMSALALAAAEAEAMAAGRNSPAFFRIKQEPKQEPAPAAPAAAASPAPAAVSSVPEAAEGSSPAQQATAPAPAAAASSDQPQQQPQQQQQPVLGPFQQLLLADVDEQPAPVQQQQQQQPAAASAPEQLHNAEWQPQQAPVAAAVSDAAAAAATAAGSAALSVFGSAVATEQQGM